MSDPTTIGLFLAVVAVAVLAQRGRARPDRLPPGSGEPDHAEFRAAREYVVDDDIAPEPARIALRDAPAAKREAAKTARTELRRIPSPRPSASLRATNQGVSVMPPLPALPKLHRVQAREALPALSAAVPMFPTSPLL